jgi:hypothetical protein
MTYQNVRSRGLWKNPNQRRSRHLGAYVFDGVLYWHGRVYLHFQSDGAPRFTVCSPFSPVERPWKRAAINCCFVCVKWLGLCGKPLEARVGIEPTNKGSSDLLLTKVQKPVFIMLKRTF